jgi:hypothetical protein
LLPNETGNTLEQLFTTELRCCWKWLRHNGFLLVSVGIFCNKFTLRRDSLPPIQSNSEMIRQIQRAAGVCQQRSCALMPTNLNLPTGPSSEWTEDQWFAPATLVRLIFKHLADDLLGYSEDSDDITVVEVIAAADKAIKEGRLPDAFFDEFVQAADKRGGGRVQ